MTKVVYSVTGAEVNLSGASTDDLAEVVDGMNDEISRISEARQLIMRELVRRMEGATTVATEEWALSFKPFVNVKRRLPE